MRSIRGNLDGTKEPAKADLRHTHDYIAEDSKRYARKVFREMVKKLISLTKHPNKDDNVKEGLF